MDEQERTTSPEVDIPDSAGHKAPEEILREIEETRGELRETVEALAEKADVKGRVTGRISEVKDTAAQKKDDLIGKVKHVTPETANASAQHVVASAQRKPVPYAAAGALAFGLLLGWLLGRRR